MGFCFLPNILIRMPFPRKDPVGGFDFPLSRRLRNAEHKVMIGSARLLHFDAWLGDLTDK